MALSFCPPAEVTTSQNNFVLSSPTIMVGSHIQYLIDLFEILEISYIFILFSVSSASG